VNNSTQYLTDADLSAIATYLRSLSPVRGETGPVYAYDESTANDLKARRFDKPGALLYMQYCKSCHVEDGRGYGVYLPPLAGNTSVLDPDPSSIINVTLNGSARLVIQGMPDSYRMPPFRVLLNDRQIADLVNFIRTGWGNAAPPVSVEQVAEIRAHTFPSSDRIEVLKMK
jgi:mono/diheme cytochrome c family protein